MKAVAVLGALLMAGVEIVMLLLHQRQFLLWAAGIAMALPLFGVRSMLGASKTEPDTEPTRDRAAPDDPGDLLRHWLSSTESRIHWSESTRRDWDRRWRPVLARQFESSTGQRHTKDPVAFDAAGRRLFGAALWRWVEPGNVVRTGGSESGPGREVLEEILHRLDQR